jgi:hypothetical protein
MDKFYIFTDLSKEIKVLLKLEDIRDAKENSYCGANSVLTYYNGEELQELYVKETVEELRAILNDTDRPVTKEVMITNELMAPMHGPHFELKHS